MDEKVVFCKDCRSRFGKKYRVDGLSGFCKEQEIFVGRKQKSCVKFKSKKGE